MTSVTEVVGARNKGTYARRVVSQSEVRAARELQAREYARSAIIEDLPQSGVMEDHFVDFSEYYASYANGAMTGSCRLIPGNASTLPTPQNFEIFPEYRRALAAVRSGDLAEVSRLAVTDSAANFDAKMHLFRSMLHRCIATGDMTVWVAIVEEPLITILDRFLGIPVERIGPIDTTTYADPNTPVMIDTIRYLAEGRLRSPRRWQFFSEGLVIDLTTSAREPIVA